MAEIVPEVRGMSPTIKEAVIEMIQRMPDDVNVTDIMAELYLRKKVDEGLKQLDAGQSVDHAEVVQRLHR